MRETSITRRELLISPLLFAISKDAKALEDDETLSDEFKELRDIAPGLIGTQGYFSRIYYEPDCAALLKDLVNYLLETQQDIIDVKIKDTPQVDVQEPSAEINGKAELKKGILSPDVSFSCQLKNTNPGKISINELNYSYKSFIDEIIDKAGYREKFESYVNDPNEGAKKALNALYKERNMEVTKVDLIFRDQSLDLTIHGNPAPSGTQ